MRPERGGIEVFLSSGAAVVLHCVDETCVYDLMGLLRAVITLHRQVPDTVRGISVFDGLDTEGSVKHVKLWEYQRWYDGLWKSQMLPTDPYECECGREVVCSDWGSRRAC